MFLYICPPQDAPATYEFHYVSTSLTWQAAEDNCLSLGGHLASAHSVEEQESLLALGGTSRYWIGGNDIATEGSWMWSDGTPWDYTAWCGPEPNNMGNEDCVENHGTHLCWNDRPCGTTQRSICKLLVATDSSTATGTTTTDSSSTTGTTVTSRTSTSATSSTTAEPQPDHNPNS